MIKQILTYNKEEDKKILSTKSEAVISIDQEKQNIQDLKDTFHSLSNDAHGISAVQIGILKRIIICY